LEKVTATAAKFWEKHRSKFQKDWMLEGIAKAINVRKTEIQILVDAAFHNWDESESDEKLLRFVKFDGSMSLTKFFNKVFISNKPNDYTLLKTPTTSCVHTVSGAASSSVAEPNASLTVENLDGFQNDALDSGTMMNEEGSSLNTHDDFTDENGYGLEHETNIAPGSMEYNDKCFTNGQCILDNDLDIANGNGLENDEDYRINYRHGSEHGNNIAMDWTENNEDFGNETGHELENSSKVDDGGVNDCLEGLNECDDVVEHVRSVDDVNEVNNMNEKNECVKSCESSLTLSASECNIGNLNDFDNGVKDLDMNDSFECEMSVINEVERFMLVVQHDHCYAESNVIRVMECRSLGSNFGKEITCVCEFCGMGYGSVNSLENHYLSVHKVVRCVNCDLDFESLDEKVRHRNESHPGREKCVYTCDLCGKLIVTDKRKKVLQSHMLNFHTHHLKCPECAATFKYKKSLYIHITNHHKLYTCLHDDQIFLGYRRYYIHSLSHTCRDVNCKKFFKSVVECEKHEKEKHFVPLCDVCKCYRPNNLKQFFKHKSECSVESIEISLKSVRDDFNRTFKSVAAWEPIKSLSSSAINHQEAIFKESILYAKDESGNVAFDPADGYPFWDNRLICPAFGSHSINPNNNCTNALRNANLMSPWCFKPFNFNSYPLGSSCMILYNVVLNMPEWVFQVFVLDDWKDFQKFKGKRTHFQKNENLPKNMQKAPKVMDKERDRGHLVAFQYACSVSDQKELQNQGNIFYQSATQNRGIWKKMETELLKEIQSRNIPRSHITTGVVYAMEGGEIQYSHEVAVVHTYYKVCFMLDVSGKVVDLLCYALQNDNTVSPKAVPRVSLLDIESIANNTHQFLNGDLIKRMDPVLLNEHSRSWIKAVP